MSLMSREKPTRTMAGDPKLKSASFRLWMKRGALTKSGRELSSGRAVDDFRHGIAMSERYLTSAETRRYSVLSNGSDRHYLANQHASDQDLSLPYNGHCISSRYPDGEAKE